MSSYKDKINDYVKKSIENRFDIGPFKDVFIWHGQTYSLIKWDNLNSEAILVSQNNAFRLPLSALDEDEMHVLWLIMLKDTYATFSQYREDLIKKYGAEEYVIYMRRLYDVIESETIY